MKPIHIYIHQLKDENGQRVFKMFSVIFTVLNEVNTTWVFVILFFIFFCIFKASQHEEKQTKRYHLVRTPVFWVSCYYSFYCRNIKIKGRGEGLELYEARARLGNCCWWRFTKSFQSASILSYFPVSEKWGGGEGVGTRKGKNLSCCLVIRDYCMLFLNLL